LQVVNGGKQFLLNYTVFNQSKTKSVWVAINSAYQHGIVRDSNGYDYVLDVYNSSGIPATAVTRSVAFFGNAPPGPDKINQAIEIQPGDSIIATAKFYSEQARLATAGDCTVQLDVLISNNFNNGQGDCATKTFSATVTAE